MPRKIATAIARAVRKAYADCVGEPNDPKAMSTRNLNFRASQDVSRDEAIAIMSEAVPDGYNEFHAQLLALLPEDARITIAREGSVCIYVKGDDLVDENLLFDEIHYDPQSNETRIWWD